MFIKRIIYLSLFLLALTNVNAQEQDPFVTYDVPAQNLLKYNRFLINPTFSTVREDKSYVNLLHRNQSASFDNNNQAYFLSYSGRVNDRTGLGVSLYSQQEGTISNFGVLANYAYGIKLSDKSNFTFGANVSYYNSGFDENRATVGSEDPTLLGLQDSNLLSFQPGFNLSYDKFDFGVFAENLFDFNLKTNESVTEFADKTFSTHLQYTHSFEKAQGLLEGGRLMPLARARKVGEDDLVLGGNLILDLPKIGWVQAGYDSFYGASAGIGFNLNQRLSLGYTMEKGLSGAFDNFGVTHEISFAYSITPNLTEDRVMLEDDYEDDVVSNEDEPLFEDFTDKDEEIAELKRRLAENDDILAELLYRQDSIETTKETDLERRFEMVMRMVRNETKGEMPELEEKAKKTYFLNNTQDDSQLAYQQNATDADDTALSKDLETKLNTINTSEDSQDYTKQDDNAAVAYQENTPNIKNDAIPQAQQNSTTSTLTTTTDSKEYVDPTNTNNVAYQTDENDVRNSNTGNSSTTNSNTGNTTQNTPNNYSNPATKDAIANVSKVTKKKKVSTSRFRNLEGVDDGYYIIANVYKNGKYHKQFIDNLNEQGVPADYFVNPNNGLKYVYLERHSTLQEAKEAYESNVGGNYDGAMWIMNVDNKYSNEAYASNVNKIKEKSSKYATDVLQKNVVVQDRTASNEITAKNLKLDGVGTGYYIIANVFSSVKNANNFVKVLNLKGLNAGYFINPKNNFRYVYLKKHNNWQNALISYYSKLNSSYDEKTWIMRVTPNLVT